METKSLEMNSKKQDRNNDSDDSEQVIQDAINSLTKVLPIINEIINDHSWSNLI